MTAEINGWRIEHDEYENGSPCWCATKGDREANFSHEEDAELFALITARIGAVREFCAAQIVHDALPGGGLTARAWCAQGVLNILDGLTDWQL